MQTAQGNVPASLEIEGGPRNNDVAAEKCTRPFPWPFEDGLSRRSEASSVAASRSQLQAMSRKSFFDATPTRQRSPTRRSA